VIERKQPTMIDDFYDIIHHIYEFKFVGLIKKIPILNVWSYNGFCGQISFAV